MSQYQSPQHAPYAPAPAQDAPGATGGLVLGILSLVLSFPLVGLVLAFIGLGMSRSAKALTDANPQAYSNGGIAMAGYVINIIGLVWNGAATLFGCLVGVLWIMAVVATMGAAGAAGAAGP